MEIWKVCKKYSNYEVSNLGNVRIGDRMLTQGRHRQGYKKVYLSKKSFFVHRLVALEYIPNPGNKPQVNHKDGNKENNHYLNLEWVTQSENIKHAYNTGMMTGKKGVINGNSKLTKNEVDAIRSVDYSQITKTRVAKIYDIDRSHVYNIIQRKMWAT